MQDIKELGRRAGDQVLFAEKVRDMLQHLDIDIGLEDELEQDDDQNQQQKDEADQDNTGSQTDGDDSSETPTTQIGRAPSELQSLMRNSYAVFCLKKKT